MSAGTEPRSSAQSPPTLRPARFEDYQQIVRLESSHSLQSRSNEDWRRMWLENPLWERLSKDWPIGWVLEDGLGRIVGSVANVPSLYQFKGRELIAANGRAWVVDGEYRSLGIFLMDEYFNQAGVDLYVNSTVGATASDAIGSLSKRVPVGDWETAGYWITGYRGFAHRALQKMRVPLAGLIAYPAAAGLRLKDALSVQWPPVSSTSVVFETTDGFDSRFDGFWEELVRENPDKLLGVRDARALCWHFAVPMRNKRIWVFTASRGGLLRGYCVLSRHDSPQGPLRRMRIVDYQTLDRREDLLPGLLQQALQRCAAEDIHILEMVGRGLPKMESFDRYVPHQRKLECWPFYCHSNDPRLSAELESPAVWEPSGFDGDASFE
jgi:hypothetical protein